MLTMMQSIWNSQTALVLIMQNGVSILKKSGSTLQSYTYSYNLPNSFPLENLFQRCKNRITQKPIYLNVHQRFIWNIPKLETIQMSCNRWTDKQSWYSHVTRVVLSHKHGVNSQYTARLDESQSHYAEWRS